MATQFMLRLDHEKLYRATFIFQDGLCCCNMALICFRLFRNNLGNLRDFFGQMGYRPPPPTPLQKISRTPMVFYLENVIRYQLVNSMYFMKGCYSCRDVVMIISCQVNSASQQAGNQPVNFYFQRISIFCFTMKVIRVTPSGGNSQPQVLIHGRLLCESML